MSNFSLGMVILIFAVVGSVVMFQSIAKRRESDASWWFILMCMSNELWTVLYAMYFLIPDENAALIFFMARYPLVMCSAMLVYLFSYKMLTHRMLDSKILWIIFIIPVVTLAVCLTNSFHGLMYGQIVITSDGEGLRSFEYSYGIWYFVHCAVSYAFMALTARLLLRQVVRMPRNFKLPVIIMLGAVAMTIISSLLPIFDRFIDTTPLITLLSQTFFYFALYHTRSVDMLFTSRDTTFEHMAYPIFVLDGDGNIMDYNILADEISNEIDFLPLFGAKFDDFIAVWHEKRNGRVFEDDPSIFTVQSGETDCHYQIQSTDIKNNSGKVIGRSVEVKNITPIMSLIHKLQDSAYYDHLTGLHNRNYAMKLLEQIDRPEYLPLCIFMGDINGLKHVNDKYGHAMGDLLLQHVADTMRQCAPKGSFFARIGGDEFLGLIPNSCDAQARELIKSVESAISVPVHPEFEGAGIAMGYTLKTDPSEDIAELMAKADAEMYSTKNNRRRR